MLKLRSAGDDMRPFTINVPSWDGKLVLAGIFIVGYYSLVWSMARMGLPEGNKEIVRDAMLQLGPPIGVIIGALFRSTAAEERREALRSSEVRAAIEAPAAPLALPAPQSVVDSVEEGTRRGLENAEPIKVQEQGRAPLGAGGVHRDRLDEPDPPAPAPADVAPGTTPTLED